MCGVAGFYAESPLGPRTARALTTALLYYSANRGQQSAGIYLDGTVLKRAGHPYRFIERPEFHNMFKKPVTMGLVHTRQPTSGELGDGQAQPFQHNETVTVHNGCFANTKELKLKFSINKPSGVDSELVTSYINTHGIQALPAFMSEVRGTAAIIVIDRGKVYVTRNDNPLAELRITMPNGKLLWLCASTNEILLSALRYVWLLPMSIRTSMVPSGRVFHVTPAETTPMHEKDYSSFYPGTGFRRDSFNEHMVYD